MLIQILSFLVFINTIRKNLTHILEINMLYRVLGELLLRNNDIPPTRVSPPPTPSPRIISFRLGVSSIGNIQVSELEGNPWVSAYLITDTPTQPSSSDSRWSTTPPTSFSL